MAPWTYADIWEQLALAQPSQPALIQGERVIDWDGFDRAACAMAGHLRVAGLQPGSKLGIYMPNAPEYLVAVNAAFKVSIAPFNINYRYGPDEIAYLADNADAEAIVFDMAFAGLVHQIRRDLPKVRRWIAVKREGTPLPGWAEDFAEIAAGSFERGIGTSGRSGDDLILLYTGGTTGRPKGVMWRQEDLLGVGNYGASPVLGLPALASPEEAPRRAATSGSVSTLVACPFMHGTGLMSACSSLNSGGFAAMPPPGAFDAARLLDEAERLKVDRIAIVGMAFAGPLLEALDAAPDRWDLSSLRNINSSGTMWSTENKQGLLRHLPQATLTDTFASSEGFQMATSHSSVDDTAGTARFTLGPNGAVFTEDGRRIEPGSDEPGLAAVAGPIPLGYYKDPEKTARTFRMIDGRRWSVPGDWARVEADGTLLLLGRGSQSINSGGEKIFPEEVEETLKRHPAVRDAAVIGLPDPRFGERICAVVEYHPARADPGFDTLARFVRERIAPFKAPRELVVVDDLARAPNGKLDYAAIRRMVEQHRGHAA